MVQHLPEVRISETTLQAFFLSFDSFAQSPSFAISFPLAACVIVSRAKRGRYNFGLRAPRTHLIMLVACTYVLCIYIF